MENLSFSTPSPSLGFEQSLQSTSRESVSINSLEGSQISIDDSKNSGNESNDDNHRNTASRDKGQGEEESGRSSGSKGDEAEDDNRKGNNASKVGLLLQAEEKQGDDDADDSALSRDKDRYRKEQANVKSEVGPRESSDDKNKSERSRADRRSPERSGANKTKSRSENGRSISGSSSSSSSSDNNKHAGSGKGISAESDKKNDKKDDKSSRGNLDGALRRGSDSTSERARDKSDGTSIVCGRCGDKTHTATHCPQSRVSPDRPRRQRNLNGTRQMNCKNWDGLIGSCPYGFKCLYIHDPLDSKQSGDKQSSKKSDSEKHAEKDGKNGRSRVRSPERDAPADAEYSKRPRTHSPNRKQPAYSEASAHRDAMRRERDAKGIVSVGKGGDRDRQNGDRGKGKGGEKGSVSHRNADKVQEKKEISSDRGRDSERPEERRGGAQREKDKEVGPAQVSRDKKRARSPDAVGMRHASGGDRDVRAGGERGVGESDRDREGDRKVESIRGKSAALLQDRSTPFIDRSQDARNGNRSDTVYSLQQQQRRREEEEEFQVLEGMSEGARVVWRQLPPLLQREFIVDRIRLQQQHQQIARRDDRLVAREDEYRGVGRVISLDSLGGVSASRLGISSLNRSGSEIQARVQASVSTSRYAEDMARLLHLERMELERERLAWEKERLEQERLVRERQERELFERDGGKGGNVRDSLVERVGRDLVPVRVVGRDVVLERGGRDVVVDRRDTVEKRDRDDAKYGDRSTSSRGGSARDELRSVALRDVDIDRRAGGGSRVVESEGIERNREYSRGPTPRTSADSRARPAASLDDRRVNAPKSLEGRREEEVRGNRDGRGAGEARGREGRGADDQRGRDIETRRNGRNA